MSTELLLQVLIVDDHLESVRRLQAALEASEYVDLVIHATDLKEADLAMDRVNVVVIDPIGMGLEASTGFVRRVRREHPHIVFVLYTDEPADRREAMRFYDGERARWQHYFRLGKRTIDDEFSADVALLLRQCRIYVATALARGELSELRRAVPPAEERTAETVVEVPADRLDRLYDMVEQMQQAGAAARAGEAAGFLGSGAEAADNDVCFIVMPYSEPWSEAVEELIFEVCQGVGLNAEIAKAMNGRFVPHDIWRGITGSRVIIADLTGANANVAYEIGLADAIGRHVVLLSQDLDVPFDFEGQRLIHYDNTVPGASKLRRELGNRLAALLQAAGYS